MKVICTNCKIKEETISIPVKSLNVIIQVCDGEYRVPNSDGREEGAYYTDD